MKKFEAGTPQRPPDRVRQNPSVLYVEDEDANWRVSAKVLAEHYDLHRARNSEEAFEMLRTKTFRAILMDIQLSNSELDGIEIVKVIRGDPTARQPAKGPFKLESAPPIIFVTAYAARYTKEELIRIGGDDVINKPIDLGKLHLSITRCMAAAAAASFARLENRTRSG